MSPLSVCVHTQFQNGGKSDKEKYDCFQVGNLHGI